LKNERVFEIDLVRGLVLFLIVAYHIVYDLYVFVGMEAMSFINAPWLEILLRIPFLITLLLISGISSVFSRDNLRRGARMLFFAFAITVVTFVVDRFIWLGIGVIWFNIIHVIAVSTLLFALLQYLATKVWPDQERYRHSFTIFLIIVGLSIVWYGQLITNYPFIRRSDSWWLLPFGFPPRGELMMDYLPLIPWLGFYLIGAGIGRISYPERKTRFPNTSTRFLSATGPLLWIGRNSLLVYIIHQPIVLALVLGFKAALNL